MSELLPVEQFAQKIDVLLEEKGAPSKKPLCGGCPPDYFLSADGFTISREYIDNTSRRLTSRSIQFGGKITVSSVEGSGYMGRQIVHNLGRFISRQAQEITKDYLTMRSLDANEQNLVVEWLNKTVATKVLVASISLINDDEQAAIDACYEEAIKLDREHGGFSGFFGINSSLAVK